MDSVSEPIFLKWAIYHFTIVRLSERKPTRKRTKGLKEANCALMRLFLCWKSIIHKPLFSYISPTFLLKSQWHLGREKGFMNRPFKFVRDHFSRYTFQKGSINQCRRGRPCSLAKGRTSHVWQGESLIHREVWSLPSGSQPIGLLVWLKRMRITENISAVVRHM